MTARRGSLTKRLTVDTVTSVDDAQVLAPEWHALAGSVSAQPFATPGMAIPWWRHLGRGSLHIVTVRNPSGALVGLAPFHRRRIAGVDLIRPLGHGLGAVAGFLQAPIKADVGRLLVDGLLADGSVPGIQATDLRLDDPVLRDSRRRDDLDVRAVLHDECPIIDVDGITGASDFLAGSGRAGLRKSLARADRELAASSVEVAAATTPDELVQAFERSGPVYDAAEADRPRLHLGDEPHRSFLLEALDDLGKRDQATYLTLLVDGEPVAFDLHVRIGSIVYAVLGRFHPAHAAISPGHLLLRDAVDRFAGSDVNRIDLQLGGDNYKTRWATGSVDTVATTIGQRGTQHRHRLLTTGLELAHRGRGGARSAVGRLTR